MGRVLEMIDELFTVKQSKFTKSKLFFTFILALVGFMLFPIFFRIEDYNYNKYKSDYNYGQEIITEYHQKMGEYPVKEAVDLNKEEKLKEFLSKNNKDDENTRLYYIDVGLVPRINELKYTFIVDIDKGTLYTRESIAYRFARWHFAIME